jgi:hypothetical protein
VSTDDGWLDEERVRHGPVTDDDIKAGQAMADKAELGWREFEEFRDKPAIRDTLD